MTATALTLSVMTVFTGDCREAFILYVSRVMCRHVFRIETRYQSEKIITGRSHGADIETKIREIAHLISVSSISIHTKTIESIQFISLVRRLRILPLGFLSKKSIEAFITFYVASSFIC